MNQKSKVCGSTAEIIRNDAGLYEGNLKTYFRAVILEAENLLKPYHNGRHMLHVMWQCYKACVFYGTFSPREVRNLLIAALFHDFNHAGKAGPDSVNIENAISALAEYITIEDFDELSNIQEIIRATEFPYKASSDELDLAKQIIRDADLSQVLDPVWLQQVILGLAAEWGKTPREVLKMQRSFLEGLRFGTSWAQSEFSEFDIKSKISEAEELLALLEEDPVSAAVAV